MTINCAIIDDEPLAAGLLKSYAEKTPFLHLTGTYGSAIEAMRELREHPVQLLFLDIQMPLDYLLKPISYDDFLRAANKALDTFNTAQRQQACEHDRFIFVKSEYKLVRVSLDDILYIEGLKDYVRIYLQDGQKLMSLMSMKKLEEYLPRPEFLRTHRSYIVHMSRVEQIDRFRIVFGSEFLPISDSYKDDVMEYFDQHTLV